MAALLTADLGFTYRSLAVHLPFISKNSIRLVLG
ncbi:hypothetical protein SAMN05444369_10928 [Capnocytophaga haemolytica]|uniref:Uncharacterized protein n=1 Tax=Capnocytophaga haemolytica TaxID=45243 RepID=A0AAX2GZY0_9FLAO|nr:hypothetical protein SAMN05444369_10928 [Capnocytophaga haemolytica]SNV10529.1 Uncharacterised protein [Capnocytophaga haemolytica]